MRLDYTEEEIDNNYIDGTIPVPPQFYQQTNDLQTSFQKFGSGIGAVTPAFAPSSDRTLLLSFIGSEVLIPGYSIKQNKSCVHKNVDNVVLIFL